MTSGYMWNQIRHPPYMVGGQNGKPVSFVASGYSNQYGVETHIISGVCESFLSCVVDSLLIIAPRRRPHTGDDSHSTCPTKNQVASIPTNRRLSLGRRTHPYACCLDGLVQDQIAWLSFRAVHVMLVIFWF